MALIAAERVQDPERHIAVSSSVGVVSVAGLEFESQLFCWRYLLGLAKDTED